MPMNDPVVGGTALVRSAINSPNYTSGSQGWAIKEDGSAEFNSITIRGSSIQDTVSLYYNGTPASGNLVMSIAPVAGTDPYGNSYVAGIGIYESGATVGQWSDTQWKITSADASYVQIGGIGFQNSAVKLGTGLSYESSPGNIASGQSNEGIATVIGAATNSNNATAKQVALGVQSAGSDGSPGYAVIEQDGQLGMVPMIDTLPTPSGYPSFRFHMGAFSGTTDTSGNLSITHGATFTPAGAIVMRNQTSAANGPFCAGVFNLGATTLGAHFINGTSSYTSSAVVGFYVVWG